MSRRRRPRRGRRLLYFACGVAFSIAVYWVYAVRSKPPDDLRVTAVGPVPVRAASVRERPPVVFAHSVIRGGARSAAELTRTLDHDPVAAAHYQGFRDSVAQLERLRRSRPAYVSYRMGNAIYWTRKAVVLAEGEAVLTDGENLARARCGNRISFTPRAPVGPEVDLDVPEPPPVGDEDNAADGVADVFGLPLVVHDLFPPYFGGGPVGMLSDGANEPSGDGYDGGFGGGGGAGGGPLMVRDPDHDGSFLAHSGGIPVVTLPSILVSFPKVGHECG